MTTNDKNRYVDEYADAIICSGEGLSAIAYDDKEDVIVENEVYYKGAYFKVRYWFNKDVYEYANDLSELPYSTADYTIEYMHGEIED